MDSWAHGPTSPWALGAWAFYLNPWAVGPWALYLGVPGPYWWPIAMPIVLLGLFIRCGMRAISVASRCSGMLKSCADAAHRSAADRPHTATTLMAE